MTQSNEHIRMAHCECGQVSFGLDGAPILTAACYCNSCQQAGAHLEALHSKAPS